jgi:ribosome-associated translation inhibitor RaiA
MYISVIFRNRPKSETVRYYAEQKFRQIVRQMAGEPIGMKIAFSAEGPRESVQVILNSGRTLSSVMTASAYSIFEAIDDLAARLRVQLKRRKDRSLQRTIRMDRRRRRLHPVVDDGYTSLPAEC